MGESGKSFRESWEQRLTDADTVSETDILNLFQDSTRRARSELHALISRRGRAATSGWSSITPQAP